jgi:drug/metabolite transporter (DMT)-like permease
MFVSESLALASAYFVLGETISPQQGLGVILPMVWLRSGRMPRPLAWCGAALAIAGTALTIAQSSPIAIGQATTSAP